MNSLLLTYNLVRVIYLRHPISTSRLTSECAVLSRTIYATWMRRGRKYLPQQINASSVWVSCAKPWVLNHIVHTLLSPKCNYSVKHIAERTPRHLPRTSPAPIVCFSKFTSIPLAGCRVEKSQTQNVFTFRVQKKRVENKRKNMMFAVSKCEKLIALNFSSRESVVGLVQCYYYNTTSSGTDLGSNGRNKTHNEIKCIFIVNKSCCRSDNDGLARHWRELC